jgi:hypothetical protein
MVCGVGFCSLANNVENIEFVSFFEKILGNFFENILGKCVIQISKTLLNISLAYP